MAIEAGRVLNQRYRLIRPVGQGSQASVWVAEHLALQTHVAAHPEDLGQLTILASYEVPA